MTTTTTTGLLLLTTLLTLSLISSLFIDPSFVYGFHCGFMVLMLGLFSFGAKRYVGTDCMSPKDTDRVMGKETKHK